MRNPRAIAMLILSMVIGLGATIVAAGWVAQQGRVASKVFLTGTAAVSSVIDRRIRAKISDVTLPVVGIVVAE